jgi:hypothetical protein
MCSRRSRSHSHIPPAASWVTLLLLSSSCSALKLTPVQKITHKVDLNNEAKTSSAALNNVLALRETLLSSTRAKLYNAPSSGGTNDGEEEDSKFVDGLVAEVILQSAEMKVLVSTIRR